MVSASIFVSLVTQTVFWAMTEDDTEVVKSTSMIMQAYFDCIHNLLADYWKLLLTVNWELLLTMRKVLLTVNFNGYRSTR